MSSKVGIIFDNFTILWCHFLKKMEKQKIFWTGNEVIMWHHLLCCDAIIGASCQYCGNAVNLKVGIHITMYLFYHVIFLLLFILPLQSRRCNCFFCGAHCTWASIAVRKFRIFVLIKITNLRLIIWFS